MYTYKAHIANVVDGDTVDALIFLGFNLTAKLRLRLAGIDTPERGQPGFYEAKEFMTNAVLGKEVTITTYKSSKYGYYLADIKVDGFDSTINEELMLRGLAKPYEGGAK